MSCWFSNSGSQNEKKKINWFVRNCREKKESQRNYRATVTGKFVAATRVWGLLRQFAVAHNVPRVADGLPAHKYRKLDEKGGLAATRCYVKRRLAKYTPARLRHTPLFTWHG